MNIKQSSAAAIATAVFVCTFGSLTAGIQWLGLNLDGLIAGGLIADFAALGTGYILRPVFKAHGQAVRA